MTDITDIVCSCPTCGGLTHWVTGLIGASDLKSVYREWDRRDWKPDYRGHAIAATMPRGHSELCPKNRKTETPRPVYEGDQPPGGY